MTTRISGMVYLLRREVSQTLKFAQATLALVSDHTYASELGFGKVLHGWAQVAQGRVQEGLNQLHEGLRPSRPSGSSEN